MTLNSLIQLMWNSDISIINWNRVREKKEMRKKSTFSSLYIHFTSKNIWNNKCSVLYIHTDSERKEEEEISAHFFLLVLLKINEKKNIIIAKKQSGGSRRQVNIYNFMCIPLTLTHSLEENAITLTDNKTSDIVDFFFLRSLSLETLIAFFTVLFTCARVHVFIAK